jgi:hypothetical protein
MATKRTKKSAKPTKKRVSKKSDGAEERLRNEVRVRMYRHGFGECFLLTFPRLGMPFHMLINCGVLMGTQHAAEVMKTVVEDIFKVTCGHLDVLVVTNRHWDKVSGFIQARDVFEKINVGQVWLAWTEDPNDRDARRLEQNKGAITRTASAIEYVRSIPQRVYYWRGGDGPTSLSGVAGARVFFLGPPRLSADLGKARSAIRATESTTASPFAESFRISQEAAKSQPAFAAYFGNNSEEEAEWRQLGNKSLASTPRVRWNSPQASINDLSLVMAIELTGPRGESKVLLFPGNAQVASWFSWHEHRWPADAAPDDPQVITGRKLLERTVLYKVSYYGSLTGTPREFGLEMMSSPDLVAMIAVDNGMAIKKRWRFPAAEVLMALNEKTGGRIIRSDFGIAPAKGKRSTITDSEWEQFKNATRETNLYIDHLVTIPQLTAAERQKSAVNWAAANERRVYLVDKKLAGTIKPEEEAELREIEQLMDEYLSVTAPTGFGLLTELRDTVERAKGSAR